MNQNSYRNLIAAADDGFGKRLLRLLLRIISVVYRTVVCLRNFCYDRGIFRAYKADVLVISVGNITTGGTGKTPLVIWLCSLLAEKSLKCAVLTRGYKTEQGKLTDEPAILAKSCHEATIVVDGDRVSGAQKAVTEFEAKLIVMDDGFQHRRLSRNLDIVTIDATCPFGYGRLLPAGFLREPVGSLRRADVVVITRYDQVTEDKIAEVEKTIAKIAPGIPIAKAVHRHPCAKMIKGQKLSIADLEAKTIFAFCGVGNPEAFLNRLEELGLNVVGSKVYNDHYRYSERDVTDIYEEAKYLGADLILSTQKDWFKTALLSQRENDILFAYLEVTLDFVKGADTIEALVDKVIQRLNG